MFARLIPVVAVVMALGWAASFAQPPKARTDPKDAPKVETKADGAVFELRTFDDTVMKVVLLEPALALNTKYGKLTIPAAELRRLEFGFRYPDGLEEKINRAVGELGSPDFRTREDAEQALAGIGHFAIPALRRAVKGDDPETVRRAQSVLKLLDGKLGEGKAELRDYDVVETAEFTVKGRLEIGVLKVRTKYFGDATVKLTDIKSFRSAGSASNGEFSLDAARYAKINLGEWMETSIEVTAGQQLEVTASGRVDQWPQGPGQYTVGPEGQGAGFRPGGQPGVGTPGQVVGRVGTSGSPFAVGASFKGKVTESGRLYLRIGPSPWNCDSTGTYKVVVNVSSP
jgi:hypothetical protein